ncbi:MAG TPA: GntR family transcriptional regulator [Candidatus Micrarchaeia archaeon]|nr:GntR family transcriptional regulator [Candidatus Micrarchaeia archaeon]
MPVDRSDPLPLWAQLMSELRTRLAVGAFDQRFPTELELAESYQVSRHTVREAIRRLRDDGLISSHRGRGTVVNRTRFDQRLGALYSLFQAVEAQGAMQRSRVRRLDVRTDPVAARQLGLDPADQLLYLERLRLADDIPLALDRAWLPIALTGPLLEADFHHTALYDQLAVRCGIRPDSGREAIRAVVPQPQERRVLWLASGAAAFLVERLSHAQGRPVEWRSTVVRGDRYSFVVDWRPGTGARVALAARWTAPDSG